MWGEPWQTHLALECEFLKGLLFGDLVQEKQATAVPCACVSSHVPSLMLNLTD